MVRLYEWKSLLPLLLSDAVLVITCDFLAYLSAEVVVSGIFYTGNKEDGTWLLCLALDK